MMKTTSSATISHAMPIKAKTGKSVVKNKILRIGEEAIKSGIRLDSNDGITDLVESRIKSGVRLDSVNSNNGVIDLVVPVNHDY